MSSMPKKTPFLSLEHKLWLCFALIFSLNLVLWQFTRPRQEVWINVPPVPTEQSVALSSLGDLQFAYRSLSVMLQNLGDEGGRMTPLRDYNFPDLGRWFFLMDRLDSRSNYIPYIAAYYYGAVNGDEVAEKLRPVVDYLHAVGSSDEGEKWRWLAHAVYLARFKMHDLDYALSMARELSAMGFRRLDDMPPWTRQMPAFVLNAKGDKQAALALMMGLLSSVGDKVHPAEVNHTRGYICEQILTPEEAAKFPLCVEPDEATE